MKKEIAIFLTALQFYTRIPIPKGGEFNAEYLKQSARYFSLIGWVVGGVGAGVFCSANLIFSIEVSLLLSFVGTILTTGAFHEDGFADVCDGFGGGWEKEKIISIMKDSRLGTFGIVGLILILLLKFFALSVLSVDKIVPILLFGHVFSRTIATRMLLRGSYVQSAAKSKVKNAAHQLSNSSFFINLLIGFSSFLVLNNFYFLLLILPLYFVEELMFRYFKKWIGGYTGDCIGSVQQVIELLIYLLAILVGH